MIALVEFFGEVMGVAGIALAYPIWFSRKENLRRK